MTPADLVERIRSLAQALAQIQAAVDRLHEIEVGQERTMQDLAATLRRAIEKGESHE